MRTGHRFLLPSTLMLGLCTVSWAQTTPDAGSISQQITPSRMLTLPQAEQLPKTIPAQTLAPRAGATVRIQSFQFSGNQLLSTSDLSAAAAPFTNRELGFEELQSAADAVASAYREAGWIVRVYLPEQEINAGVITLQVVEASFAGVRVEGTPSKRVRAEQIEAWFTSRQPTAQALNAHALDRALLLVDDLPGLSVAGTLAPGPTDGETALVLQTTDEAFVDGDVGLDNQGARSTGSNRMSANLNINSPGGRGELVSLNLLHSQGSDYGRVAFTTPVGYNGLRLGVSASSMDYKVIGGPTQTVNLDIRGGSSSLGLDWSYPLVRARQHNLYFSGGLDNKRFDSATRQSTAADPRSYSDYASNSLRLVLSGNRFDSWGAGGANSVSVQTLWGQLTHMQGHNQVDNLQRFFNKLNFSLSRQQNLSSAHSLLFSYSSQHAKQVLDSSERFYLGGAASVRAYPVSELGGDRGQVLSGEWRWRLHPAWVLTSFVDMGQVTALPANGSDIKTNLKLRGQGLSLGWQAPMGLNTKLTWSHRGGRNPQPTPAGTDGDGTLKLNRVWFTTSLPF